ncbi:MAG: hypothetical protein KA354_23940 [Phycisphaerae bacterium]|nr:hypothetical protein [Phycisphaerae bacterium]
MHIDIPGILRDLAQLVDRMAGVVEWRRLRIQERSLASSTSFDIADHLDEEMLDLQIAFSAAANSVREALDRPDLAASREQVIHWKQQLEQLEARASQIATTDKLIKS